MGAIANRYIKMIDLIDLFSWDVKSLLNKSNNFNPAYKIVLFREFLSKAKIDKVKIEDESEYKILGVRSYGKGVFSNRIVKGKTLKMKEYQQAKPNHLFWCKVDTKNGAFGVVKDDLADGVGSSNMTFVQIDTTKINVDFLQLLFTNKSIMQYLDSFVTGTTNRKYIRLDQLLNEIKIPLPTLSEQDKLVNDYAGKINKAKDLEQEANDLEGEIEGYLFNELGVKSLEVSKVIKGLQFFQYSEIENWGIDKILLFSKNIETHYKVSTLNAMEYVIKDIFRGKSPKYSEISGKTILNQKCNRWNSIDLQFSKKVDEKWLQNVDEHFFTKENDIIINSTGDGTIGRATSITKEFEGLLYDSHILLLRLDKTIISNNYFVELFNSKFIQKQIDNIKTAQSTKQTELGISNLKKLTFVIPPLEKQQQIINTISALKSNIENYRTTSSSLKFQASQAFENAIFNS